MSKRYAVISGDEVVNVILWDEETPYNPGDYLTLVPADDTIGIGWTYDGQSFIAPPPEVEEIEVLLAAE